MAILKNIIFDLGGVLINIDYHRTEKAFVALGFENFDAMYSQFTADAMFEKLETGKISNEDFYSKLIALSNRNITAKQLEEAWNALILHWRVDSLNFLETLSPNYKLFLLSNTNAIHQAAFQATLQSETKRQSIANLFTKEYYSHEIHLRKPNEDIFKFVAKDASINIEETLFIDDSINNIETAKSLGYKTHLLLKGQNIEDLQYEHF